MKMALIRMAIGIAGALGVTRLICGLLLIVSFTDPFSFFVAGSALLIVVAFASWIPAYCATYLDPIVANSKLGQNPPSF